MKHIFLIFGLALTIAACQSSSTQSDTIQQVDQTPGERPVLKASASPFDAYSASLVASYVELKDALVASNADSARIAANTMLEQISKGIAPDDADLQTKYTELGSQLQEGLTKIAEASDIEIQRTHFEAVSDRVFDWLTAFGNSGPVMYRQYCPMAFDDKGAYWLSDAKQIRNPYFGNAMLKCGSVKATIASSL
jgi:Cu(I)/Ag(I) efflux system membrane fusion protein